MEWSHLNPPDLPDWSAFFTQVVCVEAHGTRQVFVAGQVGVDAGKRLAGDGGFEAQTERAFDNLGAALGHASGRWTDVAMLTIYVAGTVDLLYAVSQGIARDIGPHLGSAWYIPTLVVPALFITHGMIFAMLLRRSR